MPDTGDSREVSARIRVVPLETGRVRLKRVRRGPRRYLAGGWRDETLPVNAFLVEHPAGLCLFDAGQCAAAADSRYFSRWHPFFRLARFELGPSDEAAARLAALGVRPDEVRWVVLSHLHTDHVGGLAAFAKAEVVVSAVEWARAGGLTGRVRGYLPQRWPAGLEPRVVDFADGQSHPVGPFSSSLDLAGDGRLLVVPAPGHTPGHVALLVLGEPRAFLLAGDLAESAEALERVAPAVARYCRDEGLVLLAAHDPRAGELAA